MDIKNKHLNLSSLFSVEKAAGDSGELVIAGLANATTKDRMGDVILQEAWNKGGLDNYAKNPIILAFHNHSKPIGKALDVTSSIDGLQIRAQISKAAGDVYELIKDGTLKAFSVGFIVKDAEYDPKVDIFKILDLELLEVSVVSVPANQDSVFSLDKAFDSEAECLEFKKSFIKTTPIEDKTKESNNQNGSKEEYNMDPIELQKLIDKAIADSAAATTKAIEVAAAAKVEEDAKAAAKAAEASRIELMTSGTEKLLADLTARVESTEGTFTKAVEDLRGEVAEKSAELLALQKSKMSFGDKGSEDGVTYAEKELAVLVARALGKKIEETKAFTNIVEKAGQHVASASWEDTVSTNMLSDLRKRLIIAPLFAGITMTGPTMKLPVNPEAGVATWVLAGAQTNTQAATLTSSGTAVAHVLSDTSITAYKLATKEFLGTEEEDDSIIALMPIIRDAMIRRTARSLDIALLRGAGAGADPISGLITRAGANFATAVPVANKITVDTLAATRRLLGVHGLDPSQVVYVVTMEAYFDLLEDVKFQTMDKAGSNATILTGQIGMALGSPVIVSGEYEAKAATKTAALAVNVSNFLVGNYKGLRVESDYLLEAQARLLVASMRLGFMQKQASVGIAGVKWAV